MSNIVPFEQQSKMAESFVKSGLFGIKTKEQALALMALCEAEGKHPALAIQEYHIIQNRPALKADAMLSRFQKEGGVVEWVEYSDTKVTGKFSHAKSCPLPVAITWTIDMAKRIGLAGRDNWKNYPRAMLRSRVISEGVRTVYPGVTVGLYSVEEVQDMVREKDITPNAGAGDVLSEEQRVKVIDLAEKAREWMNQGSLTDAWMEIDNAGLELDERLFLQSRFDSRIRRQLVEEGERQKIKRVAIENKPSVINESQHKRLEALIGDRGLDRDEVKAECMKRYGKAHFTELAHSEYDELCSQIESSAQQPAISPDAPGQQPAVAGDTSMEAGQSTLGRVDVSLTATTVPASTPTHKLIRDGLAFSSESVRGRFALKLAGRKLEDLDEATAKGVLDWLNKQLDKRVEQ